MKLFCTLMMFTFSLGEDRRDIFSAAVMKTGWSADGTHSQQPQKFARIKIKRAAVCISKFTFVFNTVY